MSGLLNDAVSALPEMLSAAAAIPGGVTLTRGVSSSAAVPAIRAWQPARLVQPDGMLTNVRPYDYLIAAADYQINGVAVEPRAADRITEPHGVFELQPIDSQHAYYLREDGMYRVHTKKVS
jgi:hypothetical protein